MIDIADATNAGTTDVFTVAEGFADTALELKLQNGFEEEDICTGNLALYSLGQRQRYAQQEEY